MFYVPWSSRGTIFQSIVMERWWDGERGLWPLMAPMRAPDQENWMSSSEVCHSGSFCSQVWGQTVSQMARGIPREGPVMLDYNVGLPSHKLLPPKLRTPESKEPNTEELVRVHGERQSTGDWGPNPMQPSPANTDAMQPWVKGTTVPLLWGDLHDWPSPPPEMHPMPHWHQPWKVG